MDRATSETFEEPVAALEQLLAERGQRYELMAIGGGALQLLGLITRPAWFKRGSALADRFWLA